MAPAFRRVLISVVLMLSVTPADAARLRIQVVEDTIADLRGGLAEVREAVCLHYRLSGDVEHLPRFCPQPPNPCELPVEVGPCDAAIPRWAFDAAAGSCLRFSYGGCQGNANNFATADACRRVCEAPDACAQPIDRGPCDGALPRFGFDASAGRCVSFRYGGCGGNDNRFATREACAAACVDEPVPVCEQPADRGPCGAAIPRWVHDPATGQCESLRVGRLRGQRQQFRTREACERACTVLDVCTLPPDPGPCDAAIPRWYHDAPSGLCRSFVWGGCAGNANNFTTLAACERSCPRCDAELCGDHQECRLWRDPACGVDRSCPPISYCADVCEPGVCPEGTRCDLTAVTCVRAPCPPVAACVPDVDPCATVRCRAGTHCELLPTPCPPPPDETFPVCEPVPVCVKD